MVRYFESVRIAWPARLIGTVVATTLLLASPVVAAQLEKDAAPEARGFSLVEAQGLSCIIGGGLAGVWAVTAESSIAMSAGATVVAALPIIATAVVAGCGGGAVFSPAIWWIANQFHSEPADKNPLEDAPAQASVTKSAQRGASGHSRRALRSTGGGERRRLRRSTLPGNDQAR